MSGQKTQPTDIPVTTHFEGLSDRRRQEAETLIALFKEVTGDQPVVWTGNIVGFGLYKYSYKSGRTGSWLRTGFAARKAKLSIYIMDGFGDKAEMLERLGPNKTGVSCLYITRLAQIDLAVLKELIAACVASMAEKYP